MRRAMPGRRPVPSRVSGPTRPLGPVTPVMVIADRVRRRRRALSVDGKALRGTRHHTVDGQALHLLSVLDQEAVRTLTTLGISPT